MENKNSQPMIIWIALIVAAFIIGTLWTKVQYLEKGGTPSNSGQVAAGQTGQGAGQPTTAPVAVVSPLSIVNLKAYAKELKLDTNKFNTCLDTKAKAAEMTKQRDYGTSIGVNGTPAFFINGKFLSGAQPAATFKEIIDKELNGTGSQEVTAYSQTLQDMAKQQAFDPKAKTVEIAATDPVKGPANALVTIVEFSDFECPFCERAYTVVEQLMKDYSGKIKLSYKQWPFPPTSHPDAENASQASLCALDQGKFWEYYDKLFLSQAR